MRKTRKKKKNWKPNTKETGKDWKLCGSKTKGTQIHVFQIRM